MSRGMHENNVLRCPFCDRFLEEPREIVAQFGNTFTGGKCECGAVYVFDGTGHNLGDAYVDGLTLAFDGDTESAWASVPGEDYDVMELGYDMRRNRFTSARASRGRPSATFLFIRTRKKDA